jgi:hypothetical protein
MCAAAAIVFLSADQTFLSHYACPGSLKEIVRTLLRSFSSWHPGPYDGSGHSLEQQPSAYPDSAYSPEGKRDPEFQ